MALVVMDDDEEEENEVVVWQGDPAFLRKVFDAMWRDDVRFILEAAAEDRLILDQDDEVCCFGTYL